MRRHKKRTYKLCVLRFTADGSLEKCVKDRVHPDLISRCACRAGMTEGGGHEVEGGVRVGNYDGNVWIGCRSGGEGSARKSGSIPGTRSATTFVLTGHSRHKSVGKLANRIVNRTDLDPDPVWGRSVCDDVQHQIMDILISY